MTAKTNCSRYESAAARTARGAGWTRRRVAGYWTHPDHATFDGRASELCRHYHILIIEGGEVVLDEAAA